MEQFQLLEGDRTLKASREQINNALSTVRSLSSGTSFPTTNLSDGMLCYRTDHKRLYQLTDAANNIWTDRIAMSIAGTAATADTVAWSSIENKPTAYPAEEHAHTYASSTTEGGPATKAEALATPRTINGTPFDGTTDITIDIGVRTVNNLAPDSAGNVNISTLPTGIIIAYSASAVPDGYLLANGADVSRTTYADLFAVIGTTYGEGNGSTTFTLPNLTDRFIQGSSTAGTIKEAGLPNITGQIADQDGTFGLFGSANVAATGAFSSSNGGKRRGGDGSASYDPRIIDFNAQNSSAIYGKSTTVQPPAVTMRYCIKY